MKPPFLSSAATRCAAPIFVLSLLATAGAASAQTRWGEEYAKRISATQVISPLSDDAFGDQINLFNGTTKFQVTDISIPGNSGLPVELTRSFDTQDASDPAPLGEWQLVVPHLSGVFAASDLNGLRCINAGMPPTISVIGTADNIEYFFRAKEYWSGNSLKVAGHGTELLKIGTDQKTPKPNFAVASGWTTKDGWYFDCLPSVQSGAAVAGFTANPANAVGEGFTGYAPNGNKYTFAWKVVRYHPSIAQNSAYGGALLERADVRLYATQIDDRFGNWVKYQWDGNELVRIYANDGREINLTYGSTITPELGGFRRLVSATAAGRTWTYAGSNWSLSSVTLPDLSKWQYNASALDLQFNYPQHHSVSTDPTSPWVDDTVTAAPCTVMSAYDNATGGSYSITHPSGLRAEYTFAPMRHGRTNVPYSCFSTDDKTYHTRQPLMHDVMSLSRKRITGAGLPQADYLYAYTGLEGDFASYDTTMAMASFAQADSDEAAAPDEFNSATSSSSAPSELNDSSFATTSSSYTATPTPHYKTVTVTAPDGTQVVNWFGKDFALNEGRLLKVEIKKAGVTYRTTTNSYIDEADVPNQPFPDRIAESLVMFSDSYTAEAVRPQTGSSVVQDGVTFATTIAIFDNFARPVSATKASSLGATRTEVTEYYNDQNKWLLGQTKSVTCTAPAACTAAPLPAGKVISKTEFDPTSALPWKTYSFGILQSTMTYNADGTLATIKDGKNNALTLSNWKRGIPQSILFPATPASPTGATKTAAVTDAGWIGSITDELGSQTVYGYDLMGRLSKITYPTGDIPSWNAKLMGFASINVAEYGLPAGHWTQTVETGTGKSTTYYDMAWRPVLVRTEDTGVTSSKSFVVNRYDINGRLVFTSYPVATLSTTSDVLQGTTTTYDPLGRVLQVKRDSEIGLLTSTTDYLTGFKTRTTDPRGFQTTTSFQVFGSPTTDTPVLILLPESVTTTISRDVFGKPLSVNRAGTYAGAAVSATRKYVYDVNERLCKTINPESGASVVNYDAAGNIDWSASGTALSALICDRGSVTAAQKTSRTFDGMNRIATVVTPSGTANLSTTYFADGLVKTLTAANPGSASVMTTYAYNKRRLLSSESSTNGITVWPLAYSYDSNGNLSRLTYPDNQIVDYFPDGLGRATLVTADGSPYVSAIGYYPNGAISGFTYRNGIVHSMTQNTRRLPARSRDMNGTLAVLDDSYIYDANGNVTDITDQAQAGLTTRGMAYDGLDRLTAAVSPAQWGNATYAYDALDNLRIADQGARQYRYNYDAATGRLSNVKNPAGAVQFALGYDVNGNMTSKNTQAMVFDSANRLSQITGKQTYIYDGQGRRVQTTDADGKKTYWVYSQSGQLIYTSEARRSRNLSYVYLGNGQVATRAVAWGTAAASVSYQHTDALGSPVAETNSSKTVVKRNAYSPYGEEYGVATIDGTGYTGHVTDQSTALIYMQQRYYDPRLGRFLSTDPLFADPNGGANFNSYWYANNNPYRFYDPDGRCTGSRIENGDGTCASSGDYTTQGLGPSMKGAKTVVQQASIEAQAKYDSRTALASLAVPTNSLEGGIRQAILRGDATELEILLGNTGEMSATDVAIARQTLAGMEGLAAEDSAMLASRYGLDWANRVNKIFNGAHQGRIGDALMGKYGSPANALVQIQRALEAARPSAGMFSNAFPEATLNVGGIAVRVRGVVIDGVYKIGTVLKW